MKANILMIFMMNIWMTKTISLTFGIYHIEKENSMEWKDKHGNAGI